MFVYYGVYNLNAPLLIFNIVFLQFKTVDLYFKSTFTLMRMPTGDQHNHLDITYVYIVLVSHWRVLCF